MSEEAQNGQESHKTVVTFIFGLLIGGLLVWAFGPGPADAPHRDKGEENTPAAQETEETTNETAEETVAGADSTDTPSLQTGDGSIVVPDQAASSIISYDDITFPTEEGWIGVRDYEDGEMGFILGVVRYSGSQGLVPENIVLQRPTVAGKTYAAVFYAEDGDFEFNTRFDIMVDGVMDTFTAQ